jgi:hypothetical protein
LHNEDPSRLLAWSVEHSMLRLQGRMSTGEFPGTDCPGIITVKGCYQASNVVQCELPHTWKQILRRVRFSSRRAFKTKRRSFLAYAAARRHRWPATRVAQRRLITRLRACLAMISNGGVAGHIGSRPARPIGFRAVRAPKSARQVGQKMKATISRTVWFDIAAVGKRITAGLTQRHRLDRPMGRDANV